MPRIKELLSEDSELKYFFIYGIDSKNKSIKGTSIKDFSIVYVNVEGLPFKNGLDYKNAIIEIEGKRVGVIVYSIAKERYDEELIPF